MRRTTLLLVLPLLAGACAGPPPPAPAPTTSAAPPVAKEAGVATWIDEYASSFGKRWGEGYAFSGYLALVRDGRVELGKAYGKANRDTGAPARPDMRFRIGSLTKQFTAAAILKLAEEGKLRPEDPLKKHLAEAPPAWDRVTLHHLLTHTSGIPSYTDTDLMNERDKAHPASEVLARMRDKPLEFDPGARFAYSNSGYYLLGLVIQRASGQPYEAYLKQHVLLPAGMEHTSTIDLPDAPDAVIGYSLDDDDRVVKAPPIDMSLAFAAGSLRSTVDDLVAWDRALSGDAVLGAASRERMFKAEKSEYAYGINRHALEGHDVLSHTGRIDGFTSYFGRGVTERVAVIVLSNNDRFDAKNIGAPALQMAVTGKRTAPPEERAVAPFDPAFVARLTGEYRLDEASRKALSAVVPKEIIDSAIGLTITADGDRVFMKPTGQPRVRVFRGQDGVLFTKQDPLELVIDPAAGAGPALGMTLKQAGLSGRYERVKAPEQGASPAP